MTKNQCEQVARIIETVFQAEESVTPFTIAEMFRLLGRMSKENVESFTDE